MRLLCVAFAVAFATLPNGCSAIMPDVVVIDKHETIQDGYAVSWKLDPGTYKVEMTASGDGAVVKWLGSPCPASDVTQNYSTICEMTQTGNSESRTHRHSGWGRERR